MTNKLILSATLLLAASLPWQAKADSFDFTFSGPGVSGSIDLTYGSATDPRYTQALAVTGISGNFSDSNNGLSLVNESISSLAPLNLATPDPTNLLTPADFSKFAVTSGLPPQAAGALTYDNLYWPTGSVPTATDYQVHGGFLDIYGLLFTLSNGDMVNFWSNGDSGSGVDYGVAVATSAASLDYEVGGVAITPEPGAFGLLGIGMAATLFIVSRRKAAV